MNDVRMYGPVARPASLRALAALLVAASGCAGEEHGLPRPMAQTDAASTAPATWVEQGVVTAPGEAPVIRERFAAGEPIVLRLPAGDAPANTVVRVEWRGPDGNVLDAKSVTTRIGQQQLIFEAPETGEWSPGEYRAVVFVGGQQVQEHAFRIEPSQGQR